MYDIHLSNQALHELIEAQDWYEKQEKGLGLRFFEAVEAAISQIKTTPYFAIRYTSIRCIPVFKFPYMIHYKVVKRKKEITVVAVFHTSRKPRG